MSNLPIFTSYEESSSSLYGNGQLQYLILPAKTLGARSQKTTASSLITGLCASRRFIIASSLSVLQRTTSARARPQGRAHDSFMLARAAERQRTLEAGAARLSADGIARSLQHADSFEHNGRQKSWSPAADCITATVSRTARDWRWGHGIRRKNPTLAVCALASNRRRRGPGVAPKGDPSMPSRRRERKTG